MVSSLENTVNRRRGLIPEDLMKFRSLDELPLSPDGTHVAYTIRRPDANSNGYISHLYVRELAASSPQCITSGDCHISSVAWSRDGSHLAYSHQEENRHSVRVWSVNDNSDQIYPIDGFPLTSLDWSADGTKLVDAFRDNPDYQFIVGGQ